MRNIMRSNDFERSKKGLKSLSDCKRAASSNLQYIPTFSKKRWALNSSCTISTPDTLNWVSKVSGWGMVIRVGLLKIGWYYVPNPIQTSSFRYPILQTSGLHILPWLNSRSEFAERRYRTISAEESCVPGEPIATRSRHCLSRWLPKSKHWGRL